MTGRDLGTYFLRVVFEEGRGYIQTWNTGGYYTHGTSEESPLKAQFSKPIYENENALIENILYMYLDGNYSCDCNRELFWRRSQQMGDGDLLTGGTCSHNMKLKRLVLERPDGAVITLWKNGKTLVGN